MRNREVIDSLRERATCYSSVAYKECLDELNLEVQLDIRDLLSDLNARIAEMNTRDADRFTYQVQADNTLLQAVFDSRR